MQPHSAGRSGRVAGVVRPALAPEDVPANPAVTRFAGELAGTISRRCTQECPASVLVMR